MGVRLAGVGVVLAGLWLVTMGVAVAGMLDAKAQSKAAAATFATFRAERDAYEGWLTDDDQSNMYAALAALRDPAQQPLMATTWQQVVAGYAAAVGGLSSLGNAPAAAVRAQAAQTTRDLADYNGFTTQVHAAVLAGDPVTAVRLMTVGNLAASNQTQADFDAISKTLSGGAGRINTQVASEVADYLLLLLVLAVVGVVVAAVILVRVARSITRPLADVEATLHALAGGDLCARSRVASSDELGRVAASLNDAIARQQAGVASLAENAETLGSAAEELSATSTQLSANAEQTSGRAGSVSEASSTVSTVVNSVAAAAEELTATSGEIAGSATEASRVATDAVALADAAHRTITQLGGSSEEIREAIQLIGEVAERTNLLALNATIEAVRAGDSGRGFKIVAAEVKELAQQTAHAAEDIGSKVSAIRTDTHNATEAVSGINEIIGQIHGLQSAIATAAQQQTAATAEITRNVNEAATATGEIALGIVAVAETASTTSSGAHDTKVAAGELAEMAVVIQHHVDGFRY